MEKEDKKNQDKLQFFYAISLIILIPLIIVLTTFLQVSASQKNINAELTKKAELTKNILVGTLGKNITNRAELQESIAQIIKKTPEISSITVLTPSAQGFMAVASNKPEILGVIFKTENNTQAWLQNKTIYDELEENSQSVMEIISPISGKNGEKLALLAIKMQTADANALTSRALKQSMVLLVITVFLVLLLMLNFLRFFQKSVSYSKLQEIDKMKDDFISMASHELKTPMAAIKGYLDMITSGLAGKVDEKAKEHLLKVLANVERLDLLVTQLLDVSRIEQERMQFDMQPVNIQKVISDVLGEYQDEAEKKKLVLQEQGVPQALPLVYADSQRLDQIFDNLVSNAVKYTPKGSVTISYEIKNPNLEVSVKDTGIGMSKDDTKRLFQKFYRIKNGKTADISGTGLGLWIAKQTAVKMNGDISVSSQENKGTIFTVTLPIIKEK